MKKLFSIVIPFYYNEDNIPHTIPRLKQLADRLKEYAVEFVFVDDGSRDNTYRLLTEEQQKDGRITLIRLSRNFGSMSAIQAGISHAAGDCVGVISADLQDPPELFIEMLGQWKIGKKVVFAVRTKREEPIMQRLFSGIFYHLLRKYALEDYPSGGFDFILIDRQIADEINSIREKNTNIMNLIFWLGHNQGSIEYVRKKRDHGKSRWTFAKKVKLFKDSFFGFSYSPIRFMSFIGELTAFVSFLYGTFVVISAITGGKNIQGWSSTIAIITFLMGIIMIMLGTIGEYLWRILDETRMRPPYIVDEIRKSNAGKTKKNRPRIV